MSPDPGRSMTVRIVFDGAAAAGKSAAARSLAGSVGEAVITPDQDGEPTNWFDWVAYTGGSHDGHPVHAEVVAVPGRDHLRDRRRRLVEWADAIVFVADGRPEQLTASVESIDLLRSDLDEIGSRPIIVLSNTRDLADAVPIEVLRRKLRLDDDVIVVEGSATTETVVRRTFIRAVGAALGGGGARLGEASGPEAMLELLRSYDADGRASPSGSAAPDTEPADSVDDATAVVTGDATVETGASLQAPPLLQRPVRATLSDTETFAAPAEQIPTRTPQHEPAGTPWPASPLTSADAATRTLTLNPDIATRGDDIVLDPREWLLLVHLTDADADTAISVEDAAEAAQVLFANGLLAAPRTEPDSVSAGPARRPGSPPRRTLSSRRRRSLTLSPDIVARGEGVVLTPREWILLVCLTDTEADTGVSVDEGIEAARRFVDAGVLAAPYSEEGLDIEPDLPAPSEPAPAPHDSPASPLKPFDTETASRNKQYRALRDLSDELRRPPT